MNLKTIIISSIAFSIISVSRRSKNSMETFFGSVSFIIFAILIYLGILKIKELINKKKNDQKNMIIFYQN